LSYLKVKLFLFSFKGSVESSRGGRSATFNTIFYSKIILNMAKQEQKVGETPNEPNKKPDSKKGSSIEKPKQPVDTKDKPAEASILPSSQEVADYYLTLSFFDQKL
jgi:hypothetical protein